MGIVSYFSSDFTVSANLQASTVILSHSFSLRLKCVNYLRWNNLQRISKVNFIFISKSEFSSPFCSPFLHVNSFYFGSGRVNPLLQQPVHVVACSMEAGGTGAGDMWTSRQPVHPPPRNTLTQRHWFQQSVETSRGLLREGFLTKGFKGSNYQGLGFVSTMNSGQYSHAMDYP